MDEHPARGRSDPLQRGSAAPSMGAGGMGGWKTGALEGFEPRWKAEARRWKPISPPVGRCRGGRWKGLEGVGREICRVGRRWKVFDQAPARTIR